MGLAANWHSFSFQTRMSYRPLNCMTREHFGCTSGFILGKIVEDRFWFWCVIVIKREFGTVIPHQRQHVWLGKYFLHSKHGYRMCCASLVAFWMCFLSSSGHTAFLQNTFLLTLMGHFWSISSLIVVLQTHVWLHVRNAFGPPPPFAKERFPDHSLRIICSILNRCLGFGFERNSGLHR